MKKRNIWHDVELPLEIHEDIRGSIVDIFYKARIEHVAMIATNARSIRGDHFHKKTDQYMLITKGSLEYWYKSLNSKKPAEVVVLKEGDLVETPKNEVHALRMTRYNEFLAFTIGVRGGKDYEKDTTRVSPSIIPDEYRKGFKRLGHQI